MSLLGTIWGEPRRPGQSTLLPLLVSIQAMVFCAKPLHNESLYTAGCIAKSEKAHERMVRQKTMQIAMFPRLGSPPKLWKDVVTLYFKSKGDMILQKVILWEADNLKMASEGTLPTAEDIEDLINRGPPDLASIGELRTKLHLALQKIGAISSSRAPAPVQSLQVQQSQQVRRYPCGGTGHGYY